MKNIIIAINKTLITLLSIEIVSTVCARKALSVIIVQQPWIVRGGRGSWNGENGRRGVIWVGGIAQAGGWNCLFLFIIGFVYQIECNYIDCYSSLCIQCGSYHTMRLVAMYSLRQQTIFFCPQCPFFWASRLTGNGRPLSSFYSFLSAFAESGCCWDAFNGWFHSFRLDITGWSASQFLPNRQDRYAPVNRPPLCWSTILYI